MKRVDRKVESSLLEYAPIDMKKSGKWMRFLCVVRGYSVKQICSLLGMSCPQSVYAWYNGRTMPSLDNLYGLSRLFQCPIDDLVLSVKDTFPKRIMKEKTAQELRMVHYYYNRVSCSPRK